MEVEEKASKILYRLRDKSELSFSEFNYLMNLLKYGNRENVSKVIDLTPGYNIWINIDTLEKIQQPITDPSKIVFNIPPSKL